MAQGFCLINRGIYFVRVSENCKIKFERRLWAVGI